MGWRWKGVRSGMGGVDERFQRLGEFGHPSIGRDFVVVIMLQLVQEGSSAPATVYSPKN